MGRENRNKVIIDEISKLYSEVVKHREGIISEGLTVRLSSEVEVLSDKIKDVIIHSVVSKHDLEQAIEWVTILKESLNNLVKVLSIDGVTLSKEVKSFLEDPIQHLKKKLFIYTHDLIRGSLSIEDYVKVSTAAVRTSFRTNLRTIYQTWVLSEVITLLNSYGRLRLIYPEYGYLSFDRSGKQKTGLIPPNAILEINGSKYVSIFIEAPRPVGWEDSSDLKRSWKLYTALRPDIMIYGGKVTNILKLDQEPSILRPNIIIECKELSDWYLRIRDVRGPFAKPLTAEEWRNKWIRGLWVGLSEVLGVEAGNVNEIIKERRGIRLREYQIVALYRRVYKPDLMYLISLHKVPQDVKKYLESEGINVIDDVGFNRDRLRDVADMIVKYAKEDESRAAIIDEELRRRIIHLGKKLGLDVNKDLSGLLRDIIDRVEELITKDE